MLQASGRISCRREGGASRQLLMYSTAFAPVDVIGRVVYADLGFRV